MCNSLYQLNPTMSPKLRGQLESIEATPCIHLQDLDECAEPRAAARLHSLPSRPGSWTQITPQPNPDLPSEPRGQCPAAHRTFSLARLVASHLSHDRKGAPVFPSTLAFPQISPSQRSAFIATHLTAQVGSVEVLQDFPSLPVNPTGSTPQVLPNMSTLLYVL